MSARLELGMGGAWRLYEWGIFKLQSDYVQRLLYIHWRMSANNSKLTSIIVLIVLAAMSRKCILHALVSRLHFLLRS